jgi:hypothetical protein
MIAGLARASDPATSHDAARALDVTPLEAAVLAELRRHVFGATINQVADALGRSLVSVSPRFKPLAMRGLIIDSGRRERGESRQTRIVWLAARP